MPSIKILENSKNGSPESTQNVIESGGNDGFNSIKETQQVQMTTNSTVANNGNTKDQPANPMQQIILIIEHKIRNLEKRKNKLESYKAIEKSGKKLTSDQKIAVSKYDECLASLELTRELCKQFQSIAAVANREAKKEAKRSVFVRAQQENAKIREVLVVQDVLKRLCTETVRKDFLNGENGACKVSCDDLMVLEKIYELVQPKRPENTAEPTFVAAIKQAADHLSAIVDGRNKSFNDSTYGSIKNVIDEIQNCGYFEKDLIVVEEELEAVKDGKTTPIDAIEAANEIKTNDISSRDDAEDLKPSIIADTDITSANSSEINRSYGFTEAPSAAAVPTPSFPIQQSSVRQNSASMLNTSGTSSLLPAPTSLSNSTNSVTSANVPNNAINIQHAAPIVPTGPVVVSPLQSVPRPQLGATTVQAVEHAYFKQHYIQQQMRPIHEVIGTANFYFLQESEIDKPDIVATPVRFENNPVIQNDMTISKPVVPNQQQQPQMNMNHLNSTANVQPNNHQTLVPKHSEITSTQHQMSTETLQSSTFSNQPFITAGGNNFNHMHPLHSQSFDQKQTGQPTSGKQQVAVKPVMVSKPNELNHIPGFASCNTTVVSTQTVLPNAQNLSPMQAQQHQQQQTLQNHAQVQRQPDQKIKLNQTALNASQTSSMLNSSFNPSIQQFPALMQGMHDSTKTVGTNMTQKMSSLVVDSTTEKLKSAMKLSENLVINQATQNMQQTKQRDEWNGSSDFTAQITKPDDQWTSSSVLSSENNVLEKNQFGLSRQSHHQKPQISANNSSPTVLPNRLEQNGNTTTNFVSNSNIQDTKANHPQPRFTADNEMNNTTSTFFKNNERYYQQSQGNSFGSTKTNSSYHQRSPMFKSRPESNGSGTTRSSGFGPMGVGVNNQTAGSNNNNDGIVDYRSNRPVNSTRNTGPPTNARPQRNHSGNGNYGGPRGSSGSNSRGQPTLNA
uniref:Caprin-1 dimerization domain-containing protein n=1 Tax=Culex tarsalis TaxID=7177 RepID=A0A1Q3FMB4_CULTA